MGTHTNSMTTFALSLSRLPPFLLYRVFIPCDLASLVLQAAGGGLSAASAGLNATGVRVALAGLGLQVVTLALFCAVYADFAVRWRTWHHHSHRLPSTLRLRLFFAAQVLAVAAIFARCAFRVDELSRGYAGPLVKREDLFIGLEGV